MTAADLGTNVVSALAIAAVIMVMSTMRDARRKAFVYALPLPISIAVVAVDGHLDAQAVVGLALAAGFLQLVAVLHRAGMPVIVADVIAAAAYVCAAWLIPLLVTIDFWWACAVVTGGWACFVVFRRRSPAAAADVPPSRISTPVKGVVVACLSFGLLSLRSVLGGAVVTFPFGGVFAVVEARGAVSVLAAVFCRNLIAVEVLLVVVRLLNDAVGVWLALAVAWAVYLPLSLGLARAFARFDSREARSAQPTRS